LYIRSIYTPGYLFEEKSDKNIIGERTGSYILGQTTRKRNSAKIERNRMNSKTKND